MIPTRNLYKTLPFIAAFAAWLVLRGISFLPFPSVMRSWMLEEEYTQNRVPLYSHLSVANSARSLEGIIIGPSGPGYVEWAFSRPGPFPTVIQPYLVPASGRAYRLLILFQRDGKLEQRTLVENMPWKYRAIDLLPILGTLSAYRLRIEGGGVCLEGLKLFEPLHPAPGKAPLLLFLWLGLLLLARSRDPWIWSVGAMTALALILRWGYFQTYYSVPLQGDPVGYWQLAGLWPSSGFFSTGSREPGFIWLVSLARLIFGNSEASLRLLGILFSAAWIPATYAVSQAFGWSRWTGLLAGGLLAFNPFAQYMAVQGYQLEAYTLVLLIFTAAWASHRWIAAGFWGGLACVTRVQSLAAVVPLLVWSAWRQRGGKRFWLSAAIPFLLLVIPYLVTVRTTQGSWIAHLNQHADYYWKAENNGTPYPGTATVATLLTHGETLRHRTLQLVQGYVQVILNPENPYNRIILNSHYTQRWNWFWWGFFLIGLVGCLVRAESRWTLLAPLFFLNGLPMFQHLYREPRLLFHVAPFFALLTARGVVVVLSAGRDYFLNRRQVR